MDILNRPDFPERSMQEGGEYSRFANDKWHPVEYNEQGMPV